MGVQQATRNKTINYMHEKDLRAVASSVHDSTLDTREKLKAKMEAIAVSNQQNLKGKDLPDKARIPTAEELEKFRQYGIEYKSLHKKASKREIRRAIQSHFNIRIYK